MGPVLNRRIAFYLLIVIIVMFSSYKADSRCNFKATFRRLNLTYMRVLGCFLNSIRSMGNDLLGQTDWSCF
ncbi:hypothetical protein Bca101_028203 [Brassica carinata]